MPDGKVGQGMQTMAERDCIDSVVQTGVLADETAPRQILVMNSGATSSGGNGLHWTAKHSNDEAFYLRNDRGKCGTSRMSNGGRIRELMQNGNFGSSERLGKVNSGKP